MPRLLLRRWGSTEFFWFRWILAGCHWEVKLDVEIALSAFPVTGGSCGSRCGVKFLPSGPRQLNSGSETNSISAATVAAFFCFGIWFTEKLHTLELERKGRGGSYYSFQKTQMPFFLSELLRSSKVWETSSGVRGEWVLPWGPTQGNIGSVSSENHASNSNYDAFSTRCTGEMLPLWIWIFSDSAGFRCFCAWCP